MPIGFAPFVVELQLAVHFPFGSSLDNRRVAVGYIEDFRYLYLEKIIRIVGNSKIKCFLYFTQLCASKTSVDKNNVPVTYINA